MKSKLVFSFILVFLAIFLSCKKDVSKNQNSFNYKKEEQQLASNKVKLDLPKMKLQFQVLLSKYRSKEISFLEFKFSLESLFKKFKPLTGRKRSLSGVSISNKIGCPSNPFDACHWLYVASECPFLPDEAACNAFYAYECSEQCLDSYFNATNEISIIEDNIMGSYQATLDACDSQTDSVSIALCKNQVNQSYDTQLAALWAQYTQAYFLFDQCTFYCPSGL